MDKSVTDIMIALIRSEICGDDLSSDIKDCITSNLLETLYAMSRHHDVCHIIASALARHELLEKGSELGAKFQKQQMLAVFRYEHLNYELDVLSEALENAKIPYLPLKGSVMRKYYREPWLRTSCDIDVLVHKDDLERAEAVFVKTLEYRAEGKGTHDVSFFSQSGVHVELHYELNEVKFRVFDVLSNVWSYSKADGGYRYAMPDELFYFYHIAHMAKHFEEGGCGLRPFIDLWILDRCVEHDRVLRDKLLADEKLLAFAEAARELSEYWFSQAEPTELALAMQQYILEGGVYGNIDNRIALHQSKRGGRLGYILSRIFIPYDTLKCYYPILEKHRWLTPICEVRRWFRILIGGKMKKSLYEMEVNNSISKDKIESTTDLIKRLEL